MKENEDGELEELISQSNDSKGQGHSNEPKQAKEVKGIDTAKRGEFYNQIESIIFIPSTPKSKLQKLLQKKELVISKLNNIKRIRFIERVGTKMIDMLGNKNPWAAMHCNRDCFSCSTPENEGNCRVEGCVYSIICLGCEEIGIKSEYTGKTSKTLWCRGQEHWQAYQEEKDDSVMWKHTATAHYGVPQEFKIILISKHLTSFTRQVEESARITDGIRDQNLNSKSEWNGPKIPRLVIEIMDKIEQLDHNGERLTAKEDKRKLPNHRAQPLTKKPKLEAPGNRSNPPDLTTPKAGGLGKRWVQLKGNGKTPTGPSTPTPSHSKRSKRWYNQTE